MDLYVLDSDFNRLGVIDFYSSVIWTRKFCGVGDFEVYIPCTAEALRLLEIGNLLMRSDNLTSLMVIQDIDVSTDIEDGNYLTVTGSSIESYIGRRIVWTQTNLSGTVTSCITTLLSENLISPTDASRQMPNIQIGTYSDFSTTMTKQVTGDNLLDTVTDILTNYDLGFELAFDLENGVLNFNIYDGTDRTYSQSENPYVTFSPDFDNILTSDYTYQSSDYKNIALVAGEGEGTDRKTYAVGTTSGLERIETYVDARDISSTTDDGTLTTDQYNELLAERGNEALAEAQMSEKFDSEVEPSTSYVFGQDYFLGDLVNVVTDYGITAEARISQITESWDENGYTCIPTFKTGDDNQ